MTQPDRTPYCHKIRYGISGAPTLTDDDMNGTHAPGFGVSPTLIELVYHAARDGKAASVSASVTGWWTRFGEPEGQVTTHFRSGPDGWPCWLAEEARLHDPDAAPPADRAALRDRIAAYRSPGTRALYCVTCARQETGWRPVAAGEVRDEAVCDFCGGRVLAVASRTLGEVVARYLPEPADRAAVLQELIAKAEEWDGHITVQELRRMAAETPQPHTETSVSYQIESRPVGSDVWRPSRLPDIWGDQGKAEALLATLCASRPDQEHRLITRTTVVTETATGPAAGAQHAEAGQ